MADGWTEERSAFKSDDLPRYLRLARLQGHLWEFVQRENLPPEQLVEDLLAIVEAIKHRQPLPGSPVPFQPPEQPR